MLIIFSGYADVFLGMLLHADVLNSIGIVRVLRLSRIVRLMQLMRKNRSLRELRKLVTMLATCFKTLLWSFLFLSLVMTGWAMLIVELINPYVLQMQASHPFDNCEECKRSTTSVMHANLMLFKTVIAGDSWGLIAVPMIESHPETAIIFVGASLTLVFGVLNLIVAETKHALEELCYFVSCGFALLSALLFDCSGYGDCCCTVHIRPQGSR